jgi:hypothetical protein
LHQRRGSERWRSQDQALGGELLAVFELNMVSLSEPLDGPYTHAVPEASPAGGQSLNQALDDLA